MDIEVDTVAFDKAYDVLKEHCNNIEDITKEFMKRLNNARQEFDDINYKRTYERAELISKEIDLFSCRVDDLKKYLQDLNQIIHEYSNGGYK